MAQVCALVFINLVLVLAIAGTLVALLTDNWYRVDTYSTDVTSRQTYNFHYGLWRLCYDEIPPNVANSERFKRNGDCIFIHEELIQRDEENMDYGRRLRLHLSRTVVGCSIAAAAIQLGVLVSLVCGVWPGGCDPVKRPCLYLSTSLLLMLATMSGMASGICFIALRDLDNTTFTDSKFKDPSLFPPPPPGDANQNYHWSFMIHWIATGLALVDSFVLLCLLRNSYETVNEKFKQYNRHNNI